MGVLRPPTVVVSAVALVVALTACDAAPGPPSATPPPSSGAPGLGGPSISMDATWRRLDEVWTFSGRVDPRGRETTVVMDIGYEITDPTAFEESIPVADGLLEPAAISGTVRTPDAEWLCVRFRAENADGDAVTPRQCFGTDPPQPLPSASPAGTGSASPEPSGS